MDRMPFDGRQRVDSMPTEYLRRTEGRIAYSSAGSGPLVVCVPGIGDLRSVYRFLAPALVDAGFRVVTVDLRGQGDSDATFDAYDDVAVGTDLVASIDELGGPAVLVGNSLGAGAAAWAAAEKPGDVAGLVLISPFVRNPPTSFWKMLAFRLALRRPWGYAAFKAYYSSLYPGRPPADLPEHLDRIDECLHKPGYWRAFVAMTHSSHAPVEARLAEIRAPTLVLMGERDSDFDDPAAEANLVGQRLKAQVTMVPNAGHYSQAEYPEVVNPLVTDFVRAIFPEAGAQP
jgi:pimeloyl-ACP methyl ester carboxylesterase